MWGVGAGMWGRWWWGWAVARRGSGEPERRLAREGGGGALTGVRGMARPGPGEERALAALPVPGEPEGGEKQGEAEQAG